MQVHIQIIALGSIRSLGSIVSASGGAVEPKWALRLHRASPLWSQALKPPAPPAGGATPLLKGSKLLRPSKDDLN
jgi:hypothetical protein